MTVYSVIYHFVLSDSLDCINFVFFFQAEDGIRDLVRSRGLGDVYKRQFLTTGVSNPVRYPCFRASASVADQAAARR